MCKNSHTAGKQVSKQASRDDVMAFSMKTIVTLKSLIARFTCAKVERQMIINDDADDADDADEYLRDDLMFHQS